METPTTEDLKGVMQEFIDTADWAAKWAGKWKTKGSLIERNVWAFAGDDGKIRVVGVIIPQKTNGPSIHASQAFLGAEWAIRCGVNLAITIGNRMAVVKAEDVAATMMAWVPYVGSSGVMVGLGPLFHSTGEGK